MPARTTAPPGRLPEGFAFLGMFPEHEIERVLLGLIDVDALAGAQIVKRLARELAVPGELAHREIHVAIARLVGQTIGFELTDQIEHLRHVGRCTRLVIGTLKASASSFMKAMKRSVN